MKKLLIILGLGLGLIVIVFGSVVTVKQFKTYDPPYPDIHASDDALVVARGKYIVSSLGHCGSCHSSVKTNTGEKTSESESFGGGKEFKLPIGTIRSPNITSDANTGIQHLTDAQIARSLRYSVGADGRALLPFMNFQNLSDEDLTALISYIRTLPPVNNQVTVRNFSILGYIANAFIIKPFGPSQQPAPMVKRDTTAEYGKYLAVSVAGCRDCHTNRSLKSGIFIGPDFGGGFSVESAIDPEHYRCISPNLTPDNRTGRISNWSPSMFIARFHSGRLNAHSPMPWEAFQKMDEGDLVAIYNYLRTLKPVNNPVPETVVKIKD